MKYQLISNKSYNPFIPRDIQNVIFYNRNIENIIEFMTPSENHLIDPYLLDNITEGIDLLFSHLTKDNKILIIVDSDVDGYTSAAILYNYIKENFNKEVEWMVHAEKKHGIDLEQVENIQPQLVICPDSSSNEYDKHTLLKEKGTDILIIDHHDVPAYSENAVVINNQLSEHYNNKWLSGAGVVFKFCQAIDTKQKTNIAEKFIDLAALGIVADMMDVRTMENRYIIQEGLKNIKNSFFQELIKRQAYSLGSQPINSIGIMFYISPLINAITRVGTLEERQNMFSAFIEGDKIVNCTRRGAEETEKETLAAKAAREAANARNRQKKIVTEIKENIAETLTEEEKHLPLLLIKLDDIENSNLTGLVANQLANEYKKPVLLLVDKQQDGFLGSGRNYGFSEISDLKDTLKDTTLFDFAEGHQSAFGAKITEENIDKFVEEMHNIFPNITKEEDVYNVDFIFTSDDFDNNMIKEIAKLRTLWGKGFDEPLIAVTDIPVDGKILQIMGKKNSKHIKFRYKNIDYIKFHVPEEEIQKFKDKKIKINVVGRCDINIYGDNFNYQLIIQDYLITEEESEFAF